MDRLDQSALLIARARAMRCGMPPESWLIVVDPVRQMFAVLDAAGAVVRLYPCSTSRFGLGEAMNSYRTPRGVHEVVARYGDGLVPGSVLVSREFTGEVLPSTEWRQPDGDKILTRILRLAGREPGKNEGGSLDSYERMIYIHGTNQEQYAGIAPSSHGCIRMKNHDVVALYDLLLKKPVWVVIPVEE